MVKGPERTDRYIGRVCFRAEGSSKIQARIEQQSVRSSQPSSQFRAPTKPGAGVKTSPSPSKDNPSPEPQLDDIKRGKQVQPPEPQNGAQTYMYMHDERQQMFGGASEWK